ncbi:hypothetical protein [Desulfovibrio psychrotolerans]|uniref:Uncharacterized protein n=1 Tax=Desulfovibrio psychrotolerans TaxID=415242 RepID=A0A7J0BPP3_9BACT|nr:hypothetical protein [Desulfovibrio psychrotolerans]GFM35588.1 hypothetical protein DSM19430T_02720 [Desulfovibrio psychrotolerans]
MFEESSFPQWLYDHLVPDDVFGAAYDDVPAMRRAWLKTAIARLHTLHGSSGVSWGTSWRRDERQWRQGFTSIAEERPVEWCVVVLSRDHVSGPRLLAGLLPALLAGVADILVVRVAEGGHAWHAPVLAALELAGQEAVVSLSPDMMTQLSEHMRTCGAGRFLLFGDEARQMPCFYGWCGGAVQVWREPLLHDIAVAQEAGHAFETHGASDEERVDVEVLRWSHPDWSVVPVHAPDGDWERALISAGDGQGFAAFAGPSRMVDIVPDSIPLMLGPGQEACWVWPGLPPAFFMQRRLSVLSGT